MKKILFVLFLNFFVNYAVFAGGLDHYNFRILKNNIIGHLWSREQVPEKELIHFINTVRDGDPVVPGVVNDSRDAIIEHYRQVMDYTYAIQGDLVHGDPSTTIDQFINDLQKILVLHFYSDEVVYKTLVIIASGHYTL
jgi:hypothetical protein